MTYYKGTKLKFEEARSVAYTGVGASYAALGDPLANEGSVLIINNSVDKDVLISFDGATDHLYLSAAETMIINIESNHSGSGQLALPKMTQIYQKRGPGGAGGSGNLFVMVGYAG